MHLLLLHCACKWIVYTKSALINSFVQVAYNSRTTMNRNSLFHVINSYLFSCESYGVICIWVNNKIISSFCFFCFSSCTGPKVYASEDGRRMCKYPLPFRREIMIFVHAQEWRRGDVISIASRKFTNILRWHFKASSLSQCARLALQLSSLLLHCVFRWISRECNDI